MIHPYQWLAHEVWLTKKLTTQCSYKTCAFISKHMSCKVVLYVRHSVAPVWQILLRHMRQTLGLRKQAVCNRHLSCFQRYFFTTTGAKRSEAILFTLPNKEMNRSKQAWNCTRAVNKELDRMHSKVNNKANKGWEMLGLFDLCARTFYGICQNGAAAIVC